MAYLAINPTPGTGTHKQFMIYQERLETYLLQLFAHTLSSEWLSIISVISFEVNIVAKHVNAKRMTILWVRFYTERKQTVLDAWYVKTVGVRRGSKRAFALPWKLGPIITKIL